MKRRGRRGKLRKLNRSKGGASGLVVAHDLDDAVRKAAPQRSKRARYYRGPNTPETGGATVVIWHEGRFHLEPCDSKRVKSLAKPPRGLAERIDKAIKEGKANG